MCCGADKQTTARALTDLELKVDLVRTTLSSLTHPLLWSLYSVVKAVHIEKEKLNSPATLQVFQS